MLPVRCHWVRLHWTQKTKCVFYLSKCNAKFFSAFNARLYTLNWFWKMKTFVGFHFSRRSIYWGHYTWNRLSWWKIQSKLLLFQTISHSRFTWMLTMGLRLHFFDQLNKLCHIRYFLLYETFQSCIFSSILYLMQIITCHRWPQNICYELMFTEMQELAKTGRCRAMQFDDEPERLLYSFCPQYSHAALCSQSVLRSPKNF